MDPHLHKFFGNGLIPEDTFEMPEDAFEVPEETHHKQVGGDHYFNAIQPWDIIRAWDLNYWEGNLIKYALRHKGKGKVEDLEKARHYLEYLIEHYDDIYPVSD